MVRVPWGPALASLGDDRARDLDQQEQRTPGEELPDCRVGEDQQQHPADLGDSDGDGIGLAGPAPWRILPGGTQPEEDHGDPHHHVAGHRDAVVDRAALVDRMEDLGEAESEDDHADHLHHRREPERPVVGVVRRGEPGEVDPRPADREDSQDESRQTSGVVAFGQQVRELFAGDSERHHEGEVIEQLEGRRRPVLLIRITAGHHSKAV